jgi:hypothetical protein
MRIGINAPSRMDVDEQKMEFLYEWCFQMSEVVQELRATTQTLMDKVILVEALLAERPLPPVE